MVTNTHNREVENNPILVDDFDSSFSNSLNDFEPLCEFFSRVRSTCHLGFRELRKFSTSHNYRKSSCGAKFTSSHQIQTDFPVKLSTAPNQMTSDRFSLHNLSDSSISRSQSATTGMESESWTCSVPTAEYEWHSTANG
jgi:hypothetical protein